MLEDDIPILSQPSRDFSLAFGELLVINLYQLIDLLQVVRLFLNHLLPKLVVRNNKNTIMS